MPIDFDRRIKPITQEEFYDIDYQVMEMAFSLHNSLGRLCHEKIYQNELAHLCSQRFASVVKEEPVVVSYRDFSKRYAIDLMVNGGALYELKAVSSINETHQKQAIQYLLLTELQHGKIVNFREPSVESEFVSTRLTKDKRFQYTITDQHWQEAGDHTAWLKPLLHELLDEWGMFLDTGLFYDAIYHFQGGQANCVADIELARDGRLLGRQRTYLLDPRTAFTISAVTRDELGYERHLRRLLSHTKLDAIQWVNLNHHDVSFKSIVR